MWVFGIRSGSAMKFFFFFTFTFWFTFSLNNGKLSSAITQPHKKHRASFFLTVGLNRS